MGSCGFADAARRRCALLLLVVPLALGCATVAVSTDYDRSVDFSRFHSFSVAGGHLFLNGIADDGNTLVKDRIHRALAAALTAKGLTETTDHPDLLVGYLGGARSRTEIEGMPPYAPETGPYWYGGWWGPGYAEWWTRTYEEGTLVIDLIDPATHKLVWRAYARTEVNTPVSDQKVRAAVEKAFKAYPPKP